VRADQGCSRARRKQKFIQTIAWRMIMTREAQTVESGQDVAAQPQKETTQRIRIEQHSVVGMLWFAGWLFSIGILQLPLLKPFWASSSGPIIWGTRLTSILP
jgi:hypothetical protein